MSARSLHFPLFRIVAIAAVAALLSVEPAYATARTWNSLGTDWNTTANWSGGAPTVSGAVGKFTTVESVQANLSASVSISGIYFSGTGTSGYDITSSNTGITFTLNGVGSTGSSGTSDSNAAPVRSEATSGTNTVDAPIILGAAAAATQVFYQASGGTLVINGAVSNTNALTEVDLKGTGVIQLNGSNTSLTAPVTINDSGTTVSVGNNNALGTNTFIFNSSGSIQAGGGSRTIANNVNFATGTPTISGANDITFNGNVTNSGAAGRTLNVNNSGNTTIAGNLFLAGDNTTGRTVIVQGTGALTVSGVIANNNAGNTTASAFTKSGTNAVTLTNANTYTGATTVTNGSLLINGSTAAASAVGVTGNTGILGGTGTVGGATTVGSATLGGNITGATNGTIGTLSLSSGLIFSGAASNLSTFLVDIGPGTNNSDRLAVTGSVDLSNPFDQILFNGSADGTSSYVLATASTGFNGTFDTVTNLPAGYQLVYGTNQLDLTPISAVPEASTWFAGALALSTMLVAQRRRLRFPTIS